MRFPDRGFSHYRVGKIIDSVLQTLVTEVKVAGPYVYVKGNYNVRTDVFKQSYTNAIAFLVTSETCKYLLETKRLRNFYSSLDVIVGIEDDDFDLFKYFDGTMIAVGEGVPRGKRYSLDDILEERAKEIARKIVIEADHSMQLEVQGRNKEQLCDRIKELACNH